ncbi:MAG TPA: non-homologous end-joining DNA ligase [Methylomirabilota bacterium]|nr:non-homologous end-joining DNA ligase [Methylomirabilota bacterium]
MAARVAAQRKSPVWAGIAVSNPDKLMYPAAGFTKADVVAYYVAVAPYMLPHLRGRPVTLKRYPDGVGGKFFYEKDAPAHTPAWVKRFPVPRQRGGPDIQYIVIEDVRTLAWCANLASLEIHPFLHRVPALDVPTAVVFDLDPGPRTDVVTCAEVGFLLKGLLDRLELQAFPKVSGSKGIQVYVPLNTAVTYAESQPFARTVAEWLEREHPRLITADMAKSRRSGRVFIDWSQNAPHKTTVAVYSLRAKRERPFVSMPVTWEELRRAIRAGDGRRLYFEPRAARARLARHGDRYRPVLTLEQALPRQFTSRLAG